MTRTPEPARRAPIGVFPVFSALLSLAVSAALIIFRPDMTQGSAFLFGDESANLFVAARLHSGASLYSEVAYPYGPLAIHGYAAIAARLGNTPLVYLWTLALASALSAAAAGWLIRRNAGALTSFAILVVAVLPSMPLPGAPIGGYTASIYMPVERLALMAAVLLWRTPLQRSSGRSAAIGLALGTCQAVRFGSGVVMLAAVVAVDVAVAVAAGGGWRRVLRGAAAVLAGFAAAEVVLLWWAFAAMAPEYAREVVWPAQMWETHRVAVGVPRWPTWGGWRMAATQYVMPALAASLATVTAARWLAARRRGQRTSASAAAVLLLVFYALGVLGFFRHEHHFRQFAWMLVPAAAATIASSSLAGRLLALAVCLPAAWPIASAVLGAPPGDTVRLDVPHGYTLLVGRETAERVAFLNEHVRGGPVLFVPHGAGWLHGYYVRHVSRHTWFYSRGVVRPFEEERFARQVTEAAAIAACTATELRRWPLPPAALDEISRTFVRSATAGGCTVMTKGR